MPEQDAVATKLVKHDAPVVCDPDTWRDVRFGQAEDRVTNSANDAAIRANGRLHFALCIDLVSARDCTKTADRRSPGVDAYRKGRSRKIVGPVEAQPFDQSEETVTVEIRIDRRKLIGPGLKIEILAFRLGRRRHLRNSEVLQFLRWDQRAGASQRQHRPLPGAPTTRRGFNSALDA